MAWIIFTWIFLVASVDNFSRKTEYKDELFMRWFFLFCMVLYRSKTKKKNETNRILGIIVGSSYIKLGLKDWMSVSIIYLPFLIDLPVTETAKMTVKHKVSGSFMFWPVAKDVWNVVKKKNIRRGMFKHKIINIIYRRKHHIKLANMPGTRCLDFIRFIFLFMWKSSLNVFTFARFVFRWCLSLLSMGCSIALNQSRLFS